MFSIRNGKTILGFCSLYQKTRNKYTIGIEISKNNRRKGIGFKATKKLIKIAKKIKLTKLYASAKVENEASINLLKKLGFEIYNKEISKNGNEIYRFFRNF